MIITPGMNKYRAGYNIPFDTHREHANRAIDSSDRYIFIGYGFGDAHLETHLSQQLRTGKEALIFTRGLSDNARDVVKNNKNVIAVEEGTNGSKIITSQEESDIPEINLWDIREMLKEVFG